MTPTHTLVPGVPAEGQILKGAALEKSVIIVARVEAGRYLPAQAVAGLLRREDDDRLRGLTPAAIAATHGRCEGPAGNVWYSTIQEVLCKSIETSCMTL
jgi:hypothetical protein